MGRSAAKSRRLFQVIVVSLLIAAGSFGHWLFTRLSSKVASQSDVSHEPNGGKLVVHLGAEEREFIRIQATPRALVFLKVPWSASERAARRAFLDAASDLSEKRPELGIEFYLLDEERESTQRWLCSIRSDDLLVGCGITPGAGTVLWIANGRIEQFKLVGPHESLEIVKDTVSLWRTPP